MSRDRLLGVDRGPRRLVDRAAERAERHSSLLPRAIDEQRCEGGDKKQADRDCDDDQDAVRHSEGLLPRHQGCTISSWLTRP